MILQDLLRYYGFALVLQLMIFTVYLSRVSRYPHSPSSVFQHVGATIVAAAATGIPTVVITSILRCVTELQTHNITMQNNLKVKAAAAVEVVVLDKTGTLTGSVVSHYA